MLASRFSNRIKTMTNLQTLIRTVDPKDRAACDELNFKFHVYRLRLTKGRKKAHEFYKGGQGYLIANKRGIILADIPKKLWDVARSLDALKAVQDADLEGWRITACYQRADNGKFAINLMQAKPDDPLNEHCADSPYLPTMQLAWMHALVQAITWKREQEVE